MVENEVNSTQALISFEMEDFDVQYLCEVNYWNLALELRSRGPICNASDDTVTCWPPTAVDETANLTCPILDQLNITTYKAYRYCQINGTWAKRTDYSDCFISIPTVPERPEVESALQYVYLVGFILSLIVLAISLFIFCYFQSIQCTRISIHKHLVASFMLRYICMIVTLRSHVPGSGEYLREPTFCRLVLVLLEYSCMANLFWMFVEGLYLTSRLSMSFSDEVNFKVFLFIGWVSPIFAVLTWAVLMHYEEFSPCWNNYLELPYIWIVRVPMMTAIVVNSIFLINIVIILWTKLRANNAIETAQMRKAVKAVAVLFPLLGLTNLVFLWAPSEEGLSQDIYSITNAVLQASQGIFVAVIYCFLNQEVRNVVIRKVLVKRDMYGSVVRSRRTTQLTNTNGSCVIPETPDESKSARIQRKFPSSSLKEQHEMEPLTNKSQNDGDDDEGFGNDFEQNNEKNEDTYENDTVQV